MFFEKKILIMQRLKQQYPTDAKLIESLEKLLTKNKIHNFYIYFTLAGLLDCEDIPGYINKQLKKIEKD